MQIQQNLPKILNERVLWITALLTALCLAAGLVSYFFLPVEFGSTTIANNFGHQFRLAFSRTGFVFLFIYLLLLATHNREWSQQIFSNFFNAVTHPFNLAVFRIFFFAALCQWIDLGTTLRLSRLPTELRVAPFGLEWLTPIIPINEPLARFACYLLFLASFAALIGLFTSISAWVTVIVGVYALGIPQLYGNVGHYHHLIWIAAILAASRCGDYFSCDAVFAAWKRADQGVVAPPAASQAYALPLRFVWLVIGSVYFFPGVRKFWISGLDWVFTDNFRYHLYRKWLENHWVPGFRVDNYPALFMPMALSAILFEAAFIFLVFLPRFRPWIALIGFSFHSAVEFIMRISFWTLQVCYVSFVNWYGLLKWVGLRLYPRDMYVVYNGNDRLFRRAIATIRVFDLFDRITYVNVLDKPALAAHNLTWLDSGGILADIHTVVNQITWKGFAAYRMLSFRVPIFWPILPLLYIPPVLAVCDRIYCTLAGSRTCDLCQTTSNLDDFRANQAWRSRTLVMLSTFLIFVNVPFGIAGIKSAWPFACYPTFEVILGAQRQTLEIVPLGASGEIINLNQTLKQEIPFNSYRGMVRHILTDSEESLVVRKDMGQEDRLKALWQVATRNSDQSNEIVTVQFYRVTLWSPPEKWKENPASRELLFELQV
ncbi:hypothetical protein H6F95_09960 [Cyanobacteria bacterium FACHB-471]|nr:hypothetical protein [Cyanobacteria bacterium FACHB-471]